MTLRRDDTAARVLAMVRPQLLAVAGDVADRARKNLDYTLPRPATLQTFNTRTGIAQVVVDGDSTPSQAQVVTGYPFRTGDRVFTLFVPPHGLLIIGHALGFPVIAGVDYSGFSSSLAVAPSWSTLKTLTLGNEPLGRAYRLVTRTEFGIYSFAAGPFVVTVEAGASIDGGATYAVRTRTIAAPGSLLYAGGGVTTTNAGSSSVHRPMIRVRAQLAAAAGGAYDIRDIQTDWTITPQE